MARTTVMVTTSQTRNGEDGGGIRGIFMVDGIYVAATASISVALTVIIVEVGGPFKAFRGSMAVSHKSLSRQNAITGENVSRSKGSRGLVTMVVIITGRTDVLIFSSGTTKADRLTV